AVTLELQTHFIGAARMTEPLEAQVEITRETGRFLFMRGLVVQGENGRDNMASFTAIVKKAPNQKTDLQ
ncbi:MAG: hotdog domain-containing protein, partial [Parasphingorhabdus sp.]